MSKLIFEKDPSRYLMMPKFIYFDGKKEIPLAASGTVMKRYTHFSAHTYFEEYPDYEFIETAHDKFILSIGDKRHKLVEYNENNTDSFRCNQNT